MPNDSSSFFARRSTWGPIWLAFLSIVFAFGWIKSAENSRQERALRNWEVEHAELEKAATVDWNRRITEFDSLQGKPGSQKALEDELNGGAPFEFYPLEGRSSSNSETRDVFTSTDPKFGSVYSLYFDDGVLAGRSFSRRGVSEAFHPRPAYSARSKSAEGLRQQIARFSTYIWCIAIFCWLMVPSWRLVSSQVALAAAITSGIAWLVNPYYSITWQGVFSNDSLFFAAVVLASSAALLGVTLKKAVAKAPATLEFRFRLFHLLVATTAAGILLAMGPFGYVALLTTAVAATIFAAFFYFSRSPSTTVS